MVRRKAWQSLGETEYLVGVLLRLASHEPASDKLLI